MTSNEITQLKALWIFYAAYFNRTLPDEVIEMYCEDLADLDFDTVKAALAQYRRNPKNTQLPIPSKIRELVCPQIDDDSISREAAARIVAAVPKFGWNNGKDAKVYIGELGWQVVQKQGGWVYLCENMGKEISPTTFQAQARDLAKTQIQLSRAGLGDTPPSLPEPTNQRFELPQPKSLLKEIEYKKPEVES